MCVHVHSRIGSCESQRSVLGIISQVSSTLFSETGSATVLELVARKSQGSACLSLSALPALELQACKSVLGFFSLSFLFL